MREEEWGQELWEGGREVRWRVHVRSDLRSQLMHVNAYISAIPVQHSCLVNHLHFLQSHFICDILFSFFLLSFLFFWKLFFNPFSKSCFICLSVCLSVESHSKSRFYRTELITISINYVKDIKFSIEQFIISVCVFVYLSCFVITICSTWWCLFYVWLPSANQSINQSRFLFRLSFFLRLLFL